MVQGGYVSSSNAKTLTVQKKSNVLNKIPPRGPKGNSTNNSNANNNNNDTTSGIDVSINTEHTAKQLHKLILWNFVSNFLGKSTEGIDG